MASEAFGDIRSRPAYESEARLFCQHRMGHHSAHGGNRPVKRKLSDKEHAVQTLRGDLMRRRKNGDGNR